MALFCWSFSEKNWSKNTKEATYKKYIITLYYLILIRSTCVKKDNTKRCFYHSVHPALKFGGICRSKTHRLIETGETICDSCNHRNLDLLLGYLQEDSSQAWATMHSSWLCLTTGKMQHLLTTNCCCGQSRDDTIATRGRGLRGRRVSH